MGIRDQLFPRLIACLLFALAALTSAPVVFAQAAASGDASAVTITPFSIVNTEDLDFGNIIAGTTPGTVFVNTANGAVSSTGGAILAGGSPSRANFIILGNFRQIVEIELPGGASMAVTHTNGTDSMIVDRMALGNGNRNFGTFVRARLGTTNVINITVGGRLNVGANQQSGTYSGTFDMTINYF